MNKRKTIIIAVIAGVAMAVITLAVGYMVANRPLVTALEGGIPLDNEIDTTEVATFVADEADILTEKTEKIISIYNAHWRNIAGRVMAVVTVDSAKNPESAAWEWVLKMELCNNDALMIISRDQQVCKVVSMGSFHEDFATQPDGFVNSLTYMSAKKGEFDAAVLELFSRVHLFHTDGHDYYQDSKNEAGRLGLTVLVLLLTGIVYFQLDKLDRKRFRRWHHVNGDLEIKITPWRPIFPWHREDSAWYERMIDHKDFTENMSSVRGFSRKAGRMMFSGRR